MKNFRRFGAAATVAFVLLFSIVSLPFTAAARTKRCPVRIPDSLLTLYLKSDLIVVGSITSEKFLRKTHEYDYGYNFDVEKNLRVSETLKGRAADAADFVVSQFKSTDEDAAEEADFYAMKAGEQALFFLVKNVEDNSFELADYSSGMKPLDAADLDVYVKRVEELRRITKTKKNQLGELAEWLVRLVEEPVTRGEGTLDLNSSFGALDQRENDADEKSAENFKPTVLDKNFRTADAPEIAELLTYSQKQRLSTALLDSISDNLLKISNSEAGEEAFYPDYQLISLVNRWDRIYLSNASFAFLLNARGSNPSQILYLMRVINNFLDDDDLYEISSEYEDALSEAHEAETVDADESKAESVEVSSENEAVSETENAVMAEPVEQIPPAIELPKARETIEKTATKSTLKELRENLFDRFTRQYGVVVSQNSASN